jgi:hypothetical protein
MRNVAFLLSAVVALMPALDCRAQSFDGKKPFLCATVDVAECAPGEDCARESAGTVNVPQFFSVDVQQGLVTATENAGGTRTSKIERIEHPPHLLRLSGGDGNAGWIAAIEESSGKLSLAVIGDQVGFVIFGACILK